MKGFGRTRDQYVACLVSQMPPALHALARIQGVWFPGTRAQLGCARAKGRSEPGSRGTQLRSVPAQPGWRKTVACMRLYVWVMVCF